MESEDTEDISQSEVVGSKGKYAPNTYELALHSKVNQVSAPKDITELSQSDIDSILNEPLTGEEVALKIQNLRENGIALTPDNISFEEHNAYREWMDKQHFSFLGAIAGGFGQAGKDVVGGVWDAATDWKKLALGTGLSIATANPALGFGVAYGSSLLEGFARGTRDLGGLAVMAANHPDSPIYRLIINPTGDKRQLYQDFFDLAAWNDQSERIISGQSNLLMPERATYEKLLGRAMGGQIDDFIGVNKSLATASSYILDPTLYFSLGASSATKSAAKIATSSGVAALKAGHAGQALAHGVAARATEVGWKSSILNSVGGTMRKVSDVVSRPLEKAYAKIEQMSSDVLSTRTHIDPKGGVRTSRPKVNAGPRSVQQAALGAVGIYSVFQIPYGAAITGIYAGAKGIGLLGDILSGVGKYATEHGVGEAARMFSKEAKAAGRPAASALTNALVGSSVIGGYMKDLGKTMAHGSLYGGVIGYLSGGEEGAAGGIGTGLFLGAAGHNVALAHGTISGKFAKVQLVNEFNNHISYLKEQGHLLKANNLQKFVEAIERDHGGDEAIRRLSQLMMAEKSKNLVLSVLSTEDMVGALQSDPMFVRTAEDGSKVLTDLGKALQDQIDAATKRTGEVVINEKTGQGKLGGNAWNGAFIITDTNGKAVESPVMSWKDKVTGKHHIIINMDGLRLERGADGKLVKKKYTKPAVYKKVEGERPKKQPSAPAVVSVFGQEEAYGIKFKKGSRASRQVVVEKPNTPPMQGPMPAVEKLVSPEKEVEYIPAKTESTAIISEMFHQMNSIRRKAEIGVEVNNVVRNWLLGDQNKEGWAFRDRSSAVKFMTELYDKMGGSNRGSAAADWKIAISEFEKTGQLKPETLDKFQSFIEELGDTMFVGWESGKPFDYVAKGGDIGIARGLFESVKDTFSNYARREATSLGADVRTKEAFSQWFSKAKNGNKFKFDPAIEKAFTDLIRVYNEKGMKNNGRTPVRVNKLSSVELLAHAQAYGYEERLKKNEDGTYRFMSDEEYNKERHELSMIGMRQLADAIDKDESVANGLDIYITSDERDSSDAFAAAEREQSNLESESIDTIGRSRGFLYQSPDFSDVGLGLTDLVNAQRQRAIDDKRWKEQTTSAYGKNPKWGNRGRPRTSTSGRLGYEMKKAFDEGKTVIIRGIPNGKAFAILERFITKQERRNLAMLAPLVVDGGQTKANVVRGEYFGITRTDEDGVTLNREKDDFFLPRTANFVPFNFEIRLTLKNPKTLKEYKKPHFTVNANAYDIDVLTRRAQILWQENPELRDSYIHLNEFMSHIYKTIDDYSVSSSIPSTEFFGKDEDARTRRKYVTAAIGAVPTVANKQIFSIYSAEWHPYQMRNKAQENNHPWMSVKLSLLSNAQVVEGEGSKVRLNEKVYKRGQVPTPLENASALYTDAKGRTMMYQSPDAPIDIDMETPESFYQNTQGKPFNEEKLINDSNDPSKLARELGKMDMFKPYKKVALYQAADEIGASNESERKFLKANYGDAVDKGDIFLAESIKRFVRSSGDNPVVVKHTMEEHLASGGSAETYVSAFETGKPTIVTAVHGTTKKDVLVSKNLGKDVGSVALIKGKKAPIFFGFTGDSYQQSMPPVATTFKASLKMREPVGQMRSLLSFNNPLVLHNWELKNKDGINGSPMGFSLSNLDFDAIGNVAQSAKDMGHDGLILTDSFSNKKDAGNAMFIPLVSDSQVATIDTTLESKPVPRNSGYQEGGLYMRQAADGFEPLPEGAFGRNNPDTVKISRQFKSSKGIKAGDGKFIIKLNPDKSFKIGYEYDQMEHNPTNPLVKKAYDQFIAETIEQMRELQKQGYTAELNFTTVNPYANSQEVISSIREKKHLIVFSTDSGFGTNPDGSPKIIKDADIKDNPLLAMSEFKDVNGKQMRVNDVFRFVHDIFGHSERGNSFGPLGEENAWDVHSRMYSPLARRAMTTETRGQNSWVNFVNEENKKISAIRAEARKLRKEGKGDQADVLVNSVKDKDVYAPQKIGLLPEWASKIDEEMSPIEKEMFGVHQTSEGKYGMYQSADNPVEPLHPELNFTGVTDQTRGDIEFADSMLEYAEFYREQFAKRQSGDIPTDVAFNMILNKWIKENVNNKWQLRESAMTWSKLPAGDGKYVSPSEYTKEHRDSAVASLIRRDKNYLKNQREGRFAVKREETIESIKQDLVSEINALDDPEQVESKKKAAVKAILKAHAKKTLEWIDNLPPERRSVEARRILKTLGVEPTKKESWDEANKESANKLKREKEIEKIIARLNRENADAIDAGEQPIHDENSLRSIAEMEWESEKSRTEEDLSKMTQEERDAYLEAQKDIESEVGDEEEIGQEDYKLQAQQRGGEQKEKVSRKKFVPDPPRSIEDRVIELSQEAEAQRMSGGDLAEYALTDDEILKFATESYEREKKAYDIWMKPDKRKGVDYGPIESKGPIPTLTDIHKKYLGTEYFSSGGSSLMWSFNDKVYKGTKEEVLQQIKKEGIKIKKDSESIEPVYPEEMQSIIDDVNERLKNIKSEDYNSVGIGVILSLFQLWGFEINKNLGDKFFVPTEENINTVGMTDAQAKKYRAETKGKLVVRISEESKLTPAIDAVPKFLDDVQSILNMAIGNMTDGIAENELRNPSGTDLGNRLSSLIKIDTLLKKEWVAEFARTYPELTDSLFYRTKEEFVRDKINNIDFENLPHDLKSIIEPLIQGNVTKAEIKKLVKLALETSWEGQGKHPINQFFKPENKNSDVFSVEKNIGKVLRENNEMLRRSMSGVEVQKDKNGNVISYGNGLLTEEQISQQARQEAYKARVSFIEFMFGKAADLINLESAKEERRQPTPKEVEQLRRQEQAKQQISEKPVAKPEATKESQSLVEQALSDISETATDYTKAKQTPATPVETSVNKNTVTINGQVHSVINGEVIKGELPATRVEQPKQETSVQRTTVQPPRSVSDYKKPIGPQLPKQRKPTNVEKVEKKINDKSNASKAIKENRVLTPEEVGVKQADVIGAGVISSGSPAVSESTKQVLDIKDDFTLYPATQFDAKGSWYSFNKRYIVEPIKEGKPYRIGKSYRSDGAYRVIMLDHISPYDDKPLPKTVVSIVGSLEQAQLSIREHDFYQRRLFEMNTQRFSSGQSISEKLQSTAPVLTPQQTQQIAQQVSQLAQQQPSPPIASPQNKAQMHPRYNDIIRGLRGLGIPDSVIKDLTNKAIDNLGLNANIVDIIINVLNMSQGRALQVAQSNQIHTATANAHTSPITLQTASQVVILPTDAGTINATGTVIPKPPKSKNLSLTMQTLTAAGEIAERRYPPAPDATLATLKALSTFNAFNSVYSLPNGQKINGKSYKNSIGYIIQQSGIGKWRLYNPAAAIVSINDSEQEAVDKLIKHYYENNKR